VRFRRSTLLAVTIAAACAAVQHTARADEPFRLAWSRAEGTEACLSESELAARVRGRLGREPFDDRAERTIEGQVGLGPDGFIAKLVIRAPDSSVLGRRTIETRGPDCAPLGQAVTLAVVLAIDPNAPLDDAGSDSVAPAPTPVTREAEPRPVPAHIPPVLPVESAPRPPVAPVPARPAPEKDRASISAGVVGALGLLPRVAPGFELEGTYPTPSGLLLGMRFLPGVKSSDGHLGVAVTSGKLGYCHGISGVPVAACGAIEAGVTTVVARDLEPVSPGDYPFLAVSVGARLLLPARGLVRFELGAAAILPLYRQRFQVGAEDARDFQASAVAGVLFLGARLGG
jgi:hypothetical protein